MVAVMISVAHLRLELSRRRYCKYQSGGGAMESSPNSTEIGDPSAFSSALMLLYLSWLSPVSTRLIVDRDVSASSANSN